MLIVTKDYKSVRYNVIVLNSPDFPAYHEHLHKHKSSGYSSCLLDESVLEIVGRPLDGISFVLVIGCKDYVEKVPYDDIENIQIISHECTHIAFGILSVLEMEVSINNQEDLCSLMDEILGDILRRKNEIPTTQSQKLITVEVERLNEGFWTDVTATLEREGTQRPMQLRFMQGSVHLDTGKHTITASQRSMVPYLRELRALLNAMPEIDNPPPSHFREDECDKF